MGEELNVNIQIFLGQRITYECILLDQGPVRSRPEHALVGLHHQAARRNGGD